MQTILVQIILIYSILEIISLIYKVYVSDNINYKINVEIKNRGYIKSQKIILDYEGLKNLIPLYTIILNNKMLKNKKYLNDYIDNQILSGKYIPENNNISIYDEKENEIQQEIDPTIFYQETKNKYEDVTPYRATPINNNFYNEIKVVDDKIKNKVQIVDIKQDNDKLKQTAEYISSLKEKELDELYEMIYKLKKEKAS